MSSKFQRFATFSSAIAFTLSACSNGGISRTIPASHLAGGSLRPMAVMSSCAAYPDLSVAALDSYSGQIYFYTPGPQGYTLAATITLPGTKGDTSGRATFDPSGNLWVAYHDDYASPVTANVVEYAAPLSTGEYPSVVISGSNTGFVYPNSISFNSSTNTVIVGDYVANSISVFDASANGNVAPIRKISGSSTGLNFPADVRSNAQTIYVANMGSVTAGLTEYPLQANGNTAPTTTLFPNGRNGAAGIYTFDFSSDGNLYADFGAQMPVWFFTLQAGYSGSPTDIIKDGNPSSANGTSSDDQGSFWTTDQVSTIEQFTPPAYNISSIRTASLTIATPARNLVDVAVFSPGKLNSPYAK